VLVAAFFLLTDVQLLAVRVGHAHRLADLIQVVASRRGRAAADRLISSRLSVLPAGIDIAARERRIGARIVLEAIGKLRAPLNPLVDPAEVTSYPGQYEGNWRVELRDGNTLWAIRGPYEWRLLQADQAGEYVINNGFGIATPLKFIEDEVEGVTVTFTLTSGEEGTYRRLGP